MQRGAHEVVQGTGNRGWPKNGEGDTRKKYIKVGATEGGVLADVREGGQKDAHIRDLTKAVGGRR